MAVYDELTNTYTLVDDDVGFTVPGEPPGGLNANVVGNALDNAITGNDGKNILNGDLGADTLTGGWGDDTYVIDDAGDVVVELADQGIDTVQASIDIDLSLAMFSNIDVVVLTGGENLDVIGNDLGNELDGNSGDNFLFGGKGDDFLSGGGGTDQLAGGEGDDSYWIDDSVTVIVENDDEGIDTLFATIDIDLTLARYANVESVVLFDGDDHDLTGSEGDNGLYGNTGVNIIVGGAGNDTLGGGGGADILKGGSGNDVYIVDDVDGTLIELADEGTDEIDASIDYTLTVGFENLLLTGHDHITGTGNDGNNQITGNDGNNLLAGGLGSDTLTGGGGSDTLEGGKDNDVYIVGDAAGTLIEFAGEGIDQVHASISYTLAAEIENLLLTGHDDIAGTGNDGSNQITGNDGDNLLTGGLGADTLTGGGGADTLNGGSGNDVYIVGDSTGTLIELAGEGTDEVDASVSYALAVDFENLVLTGHDHIVGTGNDGNNHITGNDGSNRLTGGLGSDTLTGGMGNDVYVLDGSDMVEEFDQGGTDTVEITASHVSSSYTLGQFLENVSVTGTRDFDVTGNGADNLLQGNSGRNVLAGDAGSDTLIGGAGADVMIGGTGDDLYIVDSTGDVATEQAGGGTFDRVITSVSYTLESNLEYLAMENGAGNIGGTGNALDNTMFGNDGDNVIDGGAGRDQLNGATGNDTVFGGDGDDTINESGEGNDVLNGGAGNDDLRAEGGNDILDGGMGADLLKGGAGNDSYMVDNALDMIVESAGEGIDTVTASASFTLAAGLSIETLTATAGTAALNMSGNEGINTVLGNSGRNTISGMDGNDLLSGGKGKDVFVFSTALNKVTNLDKITDFSVKDDSIYLENDIFKKIGKGTLIKPGKLNKGFFALNKAKDKNDYIVYKSKTGVLSYDSDGSGKAKAMDFAVLQKNLHLAATDFFIT